MKILVRALEDIAEIEQERLYEEEKEIEEKALQSAVLQYETQKTEISDKDETNLKLTESEIQN